MSKTKIEDYFGMTMGANKPPFDIEDFEDGVYRRKKPSDKSLTADDIIENTLKLPAFNNGFGFRGGQRKVIHDIIQAYLDDLDYVIVDAPTGSGKSIIAMFVSEALRNFNANGYIITSDLMLQDQYISDIERLRLKYHTVKGMNNYNCLINNEVTKKGMCFTKKLTSSERKKLPCYKVCPYYSAREKAIFSRVTLLNYSYWLLQRNMVAELMEGNEPFQKRDFTFFDEAHNIDEIVQHHFALKLDVKKIMEIVGVMVKFIKDNFEDAFRDQFKEGIEVQKSEVTKMYNRLKDSLVPIYNQKTKIHTRFHALYRMLEVIQEFNNCTLNIMDASAIKHRKPNEDEIKSILDGDTFFQDGVNEVATEIYGASDKESHKPLVPKTWLEYFDYSQKIFGIGKSLDTYLTAIDEAGVNYMVIDINHEDNSVLLRNADEATLVKEKLFNQSNFSIIMSATIGNVEQFKDIMGIDGNGVDLTVPNTFKFNNSPIFMVGNRKMNWDNFEDSREVIIEWLDFIMGSNKHHKQRGVIHTASYNHMNWILENSKHKHRLIPYSNSEEKAEAIERLYASNEGVIIGPSLVEGLDLKDDLARFAICWKVPYPNIKDKLIAAKQKIDNTWYKWKTQTTIIQSWGRIIRGVDDWGTTYNLDACFINEIWKKSTPDHIKSRIRKVNPKKWGLRE